MNEPLALLLCERGLVATQLAQRLEGLRYRLLVVAKPAELGPRAEAEKPMVILADVDGLPKAAFAALASLRSNPATAHIPVISFARELDDATQADLAAQGATVVVTETAILGHLGQLLDRALDIH